MQVQDSILFARRLLNDLRPSYRWDNPTLLAFYNEVVLELQERVMFPWSRVLMYSQPNVGIYQMPDCFDVVSAYLNGQLLVPSDLQTLEGHQIQLYDSRGMGSVTPDSLAPPGGTGQNMPVWTILPPLAAPSPQGSWMYPKPDAAPSSMGQPRRYFWRGGVFTMTPAAASGPPLDTNGNPIPNICIDGVFAPPDAESLTQRSWFPRDFRKAIAWGIVHLCKFSDDSAEAQQAAAKAEQEKESQTNRLIRWAKTFQGDAADSMKVQTNRGMYARGNHRYRRTGAYPA